MCNEEKWKHEFEEYIKKDIVFMNSYPERDAYLEACKKRQSEIERLEEELKKKDQIIEKAERVIDFYADTNSWEHFKYEYPGKNWHRSIIPDDDCSHVHTDEWCTYGGKRARQYFKQKDEVK